MTLNDRVQSTEIIGPVLWQSHDNVSFCRFLLNTVYTSLCTRITRARARVNVRVTVRARACVCVIAKYYCTLLRRVMFIRACMVHGC